MTAVTKSILVVDDEREISRAVQAILEDEGYVVLTAADGVEALATLNDNTTRAPDLLLMDIMMPRMGGYDVLRALAAAPKPAGFPVVLMSCARPQVKQLEHMWRAFIKKPFTIDELLTVITRSMA